MLLVVGVCLFLIGFGTGGLFVMLACFYLSRLLLMEAE